MSTNRRGIIIDGIETTDPLLGKNVSYAELAMADSRCKGWWRVEKSPANLIVEDGGEIVTFLDMKGGAGTFTQADNTKRGVYDVAELGGHQVGVLRTPGNDAFSAYTLANITMAAGPCTLVLFATPQASTGTAIGAFGRFTNGTTRAMIAMDYDNSQLCWLIGSVNTGGMRKNVSIGQRFACIAGLGTTHAKLWANGERLADKPMVGTTGSSGPLIGALGNSAGVCFVGSFDEWAWFEGDIFGSEAYFNIIRHARFAYGMDV